MNFSRNVSRLSFSKEQFFKGTNAAAPYLLIAVGIIGFLLPLFMAVEFWMVLAKAGFILWLVVLYAGYFMRKEAYALVLAPNDIVVQRGYLLPSTRLRAYGETDIQVTLGGSRVKGIIYQYPPADADRYKEMDIRNYDLNDHLTASKRASINFLSLVQWKALSDETGLPLSIEYSHPDFEQSSFDEQDMFEIYAANEEAFEKEEFNKILAFLHSHQDLKFLGKTEVYNAREPLELEDTYHEFLWNEMGESYSLTACIDCIEFTYKDSGKPQIIAELCTAFGLTVDEV